MNLRTAARTGLRLTAGTALLLAAWLAASRLIGPGRGVPGPGAVAAWWLSAREQIGANTAQTASEAGRGFVVGNVLAVGVAVVAFLFTRVQSALVSVAVMSYCLPLVAIGPLLQITLDGDAPQVVLAALSVFFTTMIGVLTGLKSAQPTTVDVVRSLGGGRWHELRYLRAQSAFGPALASLMLAAPAAVLGALLGEFLGGDRGLGVALVNAQKSADSVRAWAYCLTAVGIAAGASGAVALAARVLAPWHSREAGVR